MESYHIQSRKRLFNFNITVILIILNSLIFLVTSIAINFYPNLFDFLALTPSMILQGKNLWTLITSMFVHANLAHLFFNMISLFFVGNFIEKIIGKKRFIWFYLISGIFAGIFLSLLSGFFGFGIGAKIFGDPSLMGVGASGAIFGLLGLLAVLIPKKKIYLIVGPLLAIVVQSVAETLLVGNPILPVLDFLLNIYVLISIFTIFSFNPKIRMLSLPVELSFWLLPIVAIVPLVVLGIFVELPIGNMAHLGGLIVGLCFGFYLRKKYKNKTKYISRVFH
jgi:membrane associated rhomboid family serine protease